MYMTVYENRRKKKWPKKAKLIGESMSWHRYNSCHVYIIHVITYRRRFEGQQKV